VQMTANYGAKSGGGKPNYQTNYQQPYRQDQRQQQKPVYSKQENYSPLPISGRSGDRSTPTGGGTSNRPTCQICGKTGHVASCCFKRFNRTFLGMDNDGRYMDKQIAAFSVTTHGSTSSFPVDPSWYADTGATDHLTNELDKLHMKENYHGKDHVHTTDLTRTEPRDHREAMGCPHWRDAMEVEFSALQANKTWRLVPPPPGVNIIDSKWVFKVKQKI
jgi:hypothetical protein